MFLKIIHFLVIDHQSPNIVHLILYTMVFMKLYMLLMLDMFCQRMVTNKRLAVSHMESSDISQQFLAVLYEDEC
jgi:hypothetical protein